ncbi:hypothetical protein [Helicobacter rappini]|nr:hypothetical protein [Helicobacter rappini]
MRLLRLNVRVAGVEFTRFGIHSPYLSTKYRIRLFSYPLWRKKKTKECRIQTPKGITMFLVIICFLLIVFTLSYFIWWLIYRKLFKSQKKISKFLVFIGAVGLIVFYYTPYSYYLEPSFYEFKKMCKLNELSDNEEKYNKILSYFGLSLDSLDYELLNNKIHKLPKESIYYKKNKYTYGAYLELIPYSNRIKISIAFLGNQNKLNKKNIKRIYFAVIWKHHREEYYFSGLTYRWHRVKSNQRGCNYFGIRRISNE